MSDNEIFDETELPVQKVEQPVKTKKPRKKVEMSDERKEQIKRNLAEGRKKALANRQKKALAKKLKKQDEVDEIEKEIAKGISKKKTNENLTLEIQELRDELTRVKSEKKEVQAEKKEVVTIEAKKEKTDEIKELNNKLLMMAKAIEHLANEQKRGKQRGTPSVAEAAKAEAEEEVLIESKPSKPIDIPKPQPIIFDATSYNRRGGNFL